MKCPYCGHKYDCHKTVAGREDFKDDDISFCIKCGRVGLFKGSTVVAFDEKRLPPDAQTTIAKMRAAWHRSHIEDKWRSREKGGEVEK